MAEITERVHFCYLVKPFRTLFREQAVKIMIPIRSMVSEYRHLLVDVISGVADVEKYFASCS